MDGLLSTMPNDTATRKHRLKLAETHGHNNTSAAREVLAARPALTAHSATWNVRGVRPLDAPERAVCGSQESARA